MIEYGLIVLVGALASVHCVGMCGMLVLAYSSRNASILFDVAYNAGRITAYALLGAIAGGIGAHLGELFSVAAWISIACGMVMIAGGLAMLNAIPVPARIALARIPAVSRIQGSLMRSRTTAGTLTLGLLTPLLPCGMLYAMLAKAATAGSVVDGAMTMAAFGVGMAPALMVLGALSSRLSFRTRIHAERLAAIVIVALGVVMILRGAHVPFFSPVVGGHCETCS